MSGIGLALGASKLVGAIAGIDWLGIIKRYWWLILGIAVAIYIAILRGEIRHRDKTIAGKDATIAADVKAMKTMTTSLHGALGAIAGNNARIAAKNTELVAEQKQAAADQARAEQRWQGTKPAVAQNEADAHRAGRAPCTVSPAAAKALEGL